ncbi:MAG: hypothetical protein JST52_04540 [Bacteroidetes bacterium]|nr:hypothetical protein [Bacteroidota bacterium]MBS1739990.1 hypothetical protein [Bacteroidota bacterium]MBS1777636.1 hypothetical protein [Bacteroidota bacterium]
MNRLKWLVGVLLLLIAFRAEAQEVLYAPYEKFDLNNGDFSVVGKVGLRTYVYRSAADGFFLEAYNDSMEKLATIMLDFFPRKIYETRFINYSDKIIVLYQAIETGKVVQYAALLDDRGRLLKGPIQLTSAKTGIWGPSRNYFSSAVSDNKKEILVYGLEEHGRTLNFSGIWLDDDLSNLQRGSATFEADNDVSHGEGIVDNEGRFFLPTFTPNGSRNYADQVWLLSLNKAARRFFIKELPLNDRYAASVFMKLDNVNNKLYTGGFYSDKKNGNYQGVLFAYYDLADSSWHNQKLIPFDEPLRMATGERNLKRAFNDYQVKQMIIKKDGGFVLISEDFYITTRTVTPGGWGGFYYSYYYSPYMSQTIREYNYNDILAISYDADGVRQWHSFVRKNQYSQEDGGIFSSYGLLNSGSSLAFLFNDFNTRSSRIQLATVDGQGKVEMQSLAAGTSNDPDWLPRSAKQVALRELIIPCLRKKQITFAKVIF